MACQQKLRADNPHMSEETFKKTGTEERKTEGGREGERCQGKISQRVLVKCQSEEEEEGEVEEVEEEDEEEEDEKGGGGGG